jgi:hypothetical protein
MQSSQSSWSILGPHLRNKATPSSLESWSDSYSDFHDDTVQNFVDLAGSERFETSSSDRHIKETQNINTSLSAFGKVILALTSKSQGHIPYRDSKLTRILQDRFVTSCSWCMSFQVSSLGGNCRTTLITCISPCDTAFAESVSSLKFANRAKSVKVCLSLCLTAHGADRTLHMSTKTAVRRRCCLHIRQRSKNSKRCLPSNSRPASIKKSFSVSKSRAVQLISRNLSVFTHQCGANVLSRSLFLSLQGVRRKCKRHLKKRPCMLSAFPRWRYQRHALLVRLSLKAALVNGGQKVHETDAFREAILEEKQRLRAEQEVCYLRAL